MTTESELSSYNKLNEKRNNYGLRTNYSNNSEIDVYKCTCVL